MAQNKFLSFSQILAEYPFSEGTLRRLLFHRDTNNLCTAILQAERKLIFHRPRFERWISSYFGGRKTNPQARIAKCLPHSAIAQAREVSHAK